MWVGSRDCFLHPLQACVLCFAGIKTREGALFGGEASYLAKIPLSFSLYKDMGLLSVQSALQGMNVDRDAVW